MRCTVVLVRHAIDQALGQRDRRGDRIHPHVVFGEINRHRAGQRDDTALGGGVGAEALEAAQANVPMRY